MITIEEMKITDFESIQECLLSDFDDFWSPKVLRAEILGENKWYFVAKRNTEVVGFIGALVNFPEMEIMNIVVKKQERQKGIGNLLLEKIIQMANDNQFQEIFLEVNETNGAALKLYEKTGFVRKGKRKNYYAGQADAIVMAKRIASKRKIENIR